MLSQLKTFARPLYYLFNDGKVVDLQGYDHLEGAKWIVDKRLGMAYFKGYYEPAICQFLLANIKPGSVFVDVGAHAGYFSLFAAQIATKGSVYSFEPEPSNFAYIQKIKQLNDLDNWQIMNKAVGAAAGQLSFQEGPSSTTGKISTEGNLKVDVVALDDELEHISRIDVIKIDVEGFGGRVLEGAMQLIKKHAPKIMFEVHAGTDEYEVLLELLGNSYILTDLDTGKVVTKDEEPHFVIAFPKGY